LVVPLRFEPRENTQQPKQRITHLIFDAKKINLFFGFSASKIQPKFASNLHSKKAKQKIAKRANRTQENSHQKQQIKVRKMELHYIIITFSSARSRSSRISVLSF